MPGLFVPARLCLPNVQLLLRTVKFLKFKLLWLPSFQRRSCSVGCLSSSPDNGVQASHPVMVSEVFFVSFWLCCFISFFGVIVSSCSPFTVVSFIRLYFILLVLFCSVCSFAYCYAQSVVTPSLLFICILSVTPGLLSIFILFFTLAPLPFRHRNFSFSVGYSLALCVAVFTGGLGILFPFRFSFSRVLSSRVFLCILFVSLCPSFFAGSLPVYRFSFYDLCSRWCAAVLACFILSFPSFYVHRFSLPVGVLLLCQPAWSSNWAWILVYIP